jgi:multidrug resistance efflux pump
MTSPTPDIPEPDERFIDGLEQQLRRGIERRARLDPTDHPTRRIRSKGTNMLATASLMVLSLTLGATGTFAVVHRDVAPQRELHLQKTAIRLERAQVRLEQHRADLAELLPLVEQGLAGDGVAARYRQKAALAESAVRRRELDLKETRITGRAPVDDLTAPLVDGADFVVQRLSAQLVPVELHLREVRAEIDRTELLVARSMVSDHELSRVRAELDEAEHALVRLQMRIELRRSFVRGEVTAKEAELRALLRDAEADHTVAAARLRVSRSGLQRLTALHEHGAVTASDLREARVEARDAESDLALAEVQLQLIRRRLEPFDRSRDP